MDQNNSEKLRRTKRNSILLNQREQEALNLLLKESGYSPLRRDRDFAWFLKDNPRYQAVMQDIPGYHQYLEPPNIAYEEMTTRVGEVLQAAYREASLVDNPEGCKKVILKMQKVAEEILADNDILSE